LFAIENGHAILLTMVVLYSWLCPSAIS